MYVAPGATFEAVATGFPSGLAGTIRVRILDNAGATTSGPTSVGIAEYPAGSGIYYVSLVAPVTAGQYTIMWDDGTVSPSSVATEDLIVTYTGAATALPSGRDLCTLADVTQLVPGYVTDAATDALLSALITSESRSAHELCQREFVTIASATTRRFDMDECAESRRRVYVGDMTSVTTVLILDQTGVTQDTVASADYVTVPRVREEWEPITHLWFPPYSPSPASPLGDGYLVEVTGVWGFPSIPADLRVGTANMVLVRYLSDAAPAGSSFADALNEEGFNAAQAFAYAQSVFRRYSRFPLR
jgi:hypothetical protein